MILAANTAAQQIANRGNAADKVNQAVMALSGGKLPCYAIPGKRVPFKWVSIGSSAVIPRSEAVSFLRRVGVDISKAEAA